MATEAIALFEVAKSVIDCVLRTGRDASTPNCGRDQDIHPAVRRSMPATRRGAECDHVSRTMM